MNLNVNRNGVNNTTGGAAPPPTPTISSFTPSGKTGDTITIVGTGFTGATVVKFGGTNAASFNVVNSTTITAVVAAGSTGSVAVTTSGGTATLAGFTYMVQKQVLVSLGSGAAALQTGNWNNLRSGGPVGSNLAITDGAGAANASLKDTAGNLTGWQIDCNFGSASNLGQAAGGAGAYPDNAIVGYWNPAVTGRTITLKNMNNSVQYTVKILNSISTGQGTPQTVSYTVVGATTVTNTTINASGNINAPTTNVLNPTSTNITITATAFQGQGPFNVIDITWLEAA